MSRPPRLGSRRGDDRFRADVVLRGGRIYRGQEADVARFDQAVAVRDGRVLAVGSDRAVGERISSGTEVVDLDGRTVIPGLIDSHTHLVRAGTTWSQETRWYETPSLAAGLDLLADRAAHTPAGGWLRVVGGWHPGQFHEGRGPTSDELTRRFPDHPVYVQYLYESAVLNQAGLRACGITAGTPDPDRGRYERDPETGEPTGTVVGIGALTDCLRQMPDPPHDDQVEGTRQLLAAFNAYGLTGAIDACGLHLAPEGYEPLFDLWRQQGMTLRTRLYVGPLTRGDEEAELAGWLRHARRGFGDDWLRHVGVGEITVFDCHDFEGLTAFSVNDPTKRRVEVVLRDAASRGWPVHMHSVLDSTTDALLDVWEMVAKDFPLGELRWSLAHVDQVSERNLDRIASLGIGVSVQHRLAYRAAASASVWGDGPVANGPRLRSIVERGIPLGAGTDATRVASPNPWVALWWMVTGRTFDDGPERVAAQCLDRATALDAYTSGSAWFSLEEHERGRLDPGMRADLAVLSDDYFDVADDDIPAIGSVLTVVDGRAVHASGPFSGLG